MTLLKELTKHGDSLHIADNEEVSGYFEGLEELPNIMEIVEKTPTNPEWKINWIKVPFGYIVISEDDCGGMDCMFVDDDKVLTVLEGKFYTKEGITYDRIKQLRDGDYIIQKDDSVFLLDFVTQWGQETEGTGIMFSSIPNASHAYLEMN